MKKLFAIIILTALAVRASGQNPDAVITYGAELDHSGGYSFVSFGVSVGKRAIPNTHTLILSPVITDGVNEETLPPVIIQGGKRAQLAEIRNNWTTGMQSLPLAFSDKALKAGKGEVVRYRNVTDRKPWMDGADLILETIDISCCDEPVVTKLMLVKGEPASTRQDVLLEETAGLFSDDLQYDVVIEPAREVTVPGTVYIPVVQTGNTGYEVQPDIKFATGHTTIVAEYDSNGDYLRDLIRTIREIQSSGGEIKRISIAGFTSPEGSKSVNEALALDRATEVKKYIMRETYLRDELFMIFNGGEDWEGLRQLVSQSDLAEWDTIVDIIDNNFGWDNTRRKSNLMRLNNGRPYRYLLENVYPKLRRAAYITIYYDNIR